MNFVKFLDKYSKVFIPLVFIVATFFVVILRVPFYDEAYAYLISKFEINEIFQMTRIEGHPFVWYFLLKIFCFNNDFYPYPMLILNWVFCAIAVVLLWQKAPFNNLIKTLITFSLPFLGYFGIIARPYALSALLIFILASMYKNSIKKPYLYSFLIVLLANITIISAISAFAFGLIFLFELFKKNASKKTILIVFFIFLFGVITLILQYFNFEIPVFHIENGANVFLANAIKYMLLPLSGSLDTTIFQKIFQCFSFILFYFSIFVLFKVNKKGLVYLFITYFIMFLLFFKFYCGAFWHYLFFIINLFTALWISWDEIKNSKYYKKFQLCLLLFLIMTLTPFSFWPSGKFIAFETHSYKSISSIVSTILNVNNSKIYSLDYFSEISPGILPYLKQKNITIYNSRGLDRTSFEAIKTNNKDFKEGFLIDKFYNSLDDTKTNYLIIGKPSYLLKNFKEYTYSIENSFIYENGKYKLLFKIIFNNNDIPLTICEIHKI